MILIYKVLANCNGKRVFESTTKSFDEAYDIAVKKSSQGYLSLVLGLDDKNGKWKKFFTLYPCSF